MKLMLVDDSIKIRTVIKNFLSTSLNDLDTVYECGTGEEAILRYRDVQPDWVLMDIELPKLDGLQATKQILREYPAAKVIIVTQYNHPMYREEAKDAGAFEYVLKENLDQIPRIIIHGDHHE